MPHHEQLQLAKAAIFGYIRECARLAKQRCEQRNIPFDPKPWNDLASTAVNDLMRYAGLPYEDSLQRVMASLNAMCLSSLPLGGDGGHPIAKEVLSLYGLPHPDLSEINQRRKAFVMSQQREASKNYSSVVWVQ
eukprot:PhF_6_TR12963/c3_g1_i5/m.20480